MRILRAGSVVGESPGIDKDDLPRPGRVLRHLAHGAWARSDVREVAQQVITVDVGPVRYDRRQVTLVR